MRIELHGYAGDCTFDGSAELPDGRLSDVLNRLERLELSEAVLTSLETGRAVSAGEVPVERGDLVAVHADGPAGEAERRIYMVRHVMRVLAGPYVIFGEFHTLPGIHAVRAFHGSRRGLAPLTGCRVAYAQAGTLKVVQTPFLLVNLRHVDEVSPSSLDAALDEIELWAASLEQPAGALSVVA